MCTLIDILILFQFCYVMDKHVINLNTGLVVLICLSTAFKSEFMIHEFDGGPLYFIYNNRKIF